MLRFAIVGCGRIAKRHADLLGGNHIADAGLSAVCDEVPERAELFGKKFGIPFYTSMQRMMVEFGGEIDIVSVLTPSGLHAEHVMALARYKKHIVVEKPMALTLDDADAMIGACHENRVLLFVVKQNRFNVPVQQLRKALQSGRFGKIVMATVRVRWCRPQAYYDQDAWRGTWALDGGVLANQASHHVDLLQWLIGDVETVFAKARTALVQTETEDTAVAVLKFRNGALGIVEATTASRPKDLEGSISILGDGGTVVIGGFAVNSIKTWEFVQPAPEDDDVMEKYSVNPPNVYGFGHQAYYEHVVACVRTGAAPMVDGFEGRKSVELVSAMYESIECGREIVIRFRPQRCKLGIKTNGALHHLSGC